MSQKTRQYCREARARGSISPKTIRAETEPDCKQGLNGKHPTAAWQSRAACRDEQQGSAQLDCVNIDHTGGSVEPTCSSTDGKDSNRQADRQRKCINENQVL